MQTCTNAVDRQGREEPLLFPPNDYRFPDLSPDGTRVAVVIGDPDNTDVWIGEVARGNLSRLTIDPASDQMPLWTPDGERVVFSSDREGPLGQFWAAFDGTGRVEQLTTIEDAGFINSASWSTDGKKLFFFYSDSPATGQDLGVLSMDGEPAWEPLLQGQADESEPHISPDGEWVAYHSNETGQREVYVQPFPELDERHGVSAGGGAGVRWSGDGRELVYGTLDGPLRMGGVPRRFHRMKRVREKSMFSRFPNWTSDTGCRLAAEQECGGLATGGS